MEAQVEQLCAEYDTVEQFIDAVGGIGRFTAIGEAFSGGDSLGLRAAVRLKAKDYLGHFHRERLDAAGFTRVRRWYQCLNWAGFEARP